MGGIILALVRRDLGSHHESRLPGAGPFRKIEGGRGRYPSLSFPSFVLSFPRPPLGRFVRIITATAAKAKREGRPPFLLRLDCNKWASADEGGGGGGSF